MPFVLFIIYVLLEIAAFVYIGGFIGVWWTLFWVVLGFFVGAWMLMNGGQASRQWLREARAGNPTQAIGKQIYWYVGGLLVMLPGFISGFLGIMLVFPPTQWLVTNILSMFIPEPIAAGFSFVSNMSSNRTNDPNTLEGKAVEIVDPKLPNSNNQQ